MWAMRALTEVILTKAHVLAIIFLDLWRGDSAKGGTRVPWEDTVPKADRDEDVIFDEFFYHWFEDASTPDHVRYFVEVSSAATPTYSQCNWAAVEIHLGGGWFRWHAFH
jgi:hypothetical protein